jgi:uncharacterized membrane protein
MKTLYIVIGILVISAILFYLIGVISPGQQSSSKIQINAPLTHSWNVYHDENLMDQWMPGLKKFEVVSGQKNTVGAKYELTIESLNGKETKMYETVTDFEAMEGLSMDYSNSMLTGTTEVEFQNQGDTATIISTANNYKGNTTFLRSMFHFFNWKIEDETQKQEDALKALIEETYSKKQKNQQSPVPIPIPIDTSSVN